MDDKGYIIVSDYIVPDSGSDCSGIIQRIIDDNPNRTIFFPDGEYLLSSPICTPADPRRSVDLRLSNYAVLRAAENWNSTDAMVRLGGIYPYNDIGTCGSNYGLCGGIIDGNGRADGISVESGRETKVRDTAIKHTEIGLHIFHGANSGSSDCDISDVNIVGTGTHDSVGMLIEGCDNTFTNMRIANVHIGVKLRSGGNCLRNIHPLYYLNGDVEYSDSAAFYDCGWDNWYYFCYSDQFSTGFVTAGNNRNIYDSCFCMWYSSVGAPHIAFRAESRFCSVVNNLKIGFRADTDNCVMTVGEEGGGGELHNLIADVSRAEDQTFRKYLTGDIRG